jgi:hypothetical protein
MHHCCNRLQNQTWMLLAKLLVVALPAYGANKRLKVKPPHPSTTTTAPTRKAAPEGCSCAEQLQEVLMAANFTTEAAVHTVCCLSL